MARPHQPGDGGLRERPFHAWLRATAGRAPKGELPLGDDVASISLPRGRLLITTDAFAEGVHFWRDTSPGLIGSALVQANLSDIASKGGRPIAFLLDVLVPPETPETWARGVVQGVRRSLARYGVRLSGGDTKSAAGRTLVGTALGVATSRKLPGRDRARPGDLFVVTGTVGGGGVAAASLSQGRSVTRRNAVLRAVRARVPEGERLAGIAHAMTDTSDGVFESIRLISEASRTGAEIDSGALPLHRSLRARDDAWARQVELVAYGGDYELLAAIPPRSLPAARRALTPLDCPLTVIGRVTSGHGTWLRTPNGWNSLPAAGWDPFHPVPPVGLPRRPGRPA
ncbi:MAG TPA: thiamine-phosphate kinase [Thermoplasmata archaeon]|nr:thiamine-phosphate kinase [Thermoplasmata archaeon]